ncbi:hypothetical protein LOD99_6921 [Oopsacas minuta]|uniref:Uncharacterized protein n=1 Tax=Oopsacas minuta TaxID=111878 RepID=A0AAV7JJN7_9METZ|nr:hypothetical protein LOD99_6921 [Oopsacas minuta]
MPRSGRPKSITTPRMKNLVRDRIRRNPLRSMRKMAAEVHISKGSMQNLVKNELDFRSYKRKTVHFLSETIKLKRLSRSKGLLTRLEIEYLDRFLFSDERLFNIEQATNKQNDRILAPNSLSIPEDVLYVARIPKLRSIMVWAGISANGRTPLIFVPEGVKINAATYRQLILEPVINTRAEIYLEINHLSSNKTVLRLTPPISLKNGYMRTFQDFFQRKNGLPQVQI